MTPFSTRPVNRDPPTTASASASLCIAHAPTSDGDPNLVDVCVSILPPVRPEAAVRKGADVCCVIDVSGSMTSHATINGSDNGTEGSGLTVLDVVKHAVRTIICSLEDQDRLSVVTFACHAKVIFGNMRMDASGKAVATRAVNALCVEGRTNLWDGLLKGMTILGECGAAANTAIFLLTDGVPNVPPPGGYLSAMRAFARARGLTKCPGPIHTFGFGYTLDSALLAELAREGGGTYNFIPDAGFVGTAFVNTLASQLAAYGTNGFLRLELVPETTKRTFSILGEDADGGGESSHTASATIPVANLSFGQSRDIVVRVCRSSSNIFDGGKTPLLITAVFDYVAFESSQSPAATNTQTISCDTVDESADAAASAVPQLFRARLVDLLASEYPRTDATASTELALAADMRAAISAAPAIKNKNYIEGMLGDITGQIREAFANPTYYSRWGGHYARSLRRAHQLQLCNNFKDPGVQFYGGDLFRHLRDAAEEVFLTLPPPTPTASHSRREGGYAAPRPAVNMQSYHNSSTTCFEGTGMVTMEGFGTKLVRDVCPGDRVLCGVGAHIVVAEVSLVVKTKCDDSPNGKTEFVKLDTTGLVVTPWHPVWESYSRQWIFPRDSPDAVTEMLPVEFVYNFVLGPEEIVGTVRGDTTDALTKHKHNDHTPSPHARSIIVNDIRCLALAHGIRGDPVASHEFFGTRQIIDALYKYPGVGETGVAHARARDIVRDPETKRVVNMAPFSS